MRLIKSYPGNATYWPESWFAAEDGFLNIVYKPEGNHRGLTVAYVVRCRSRHQDPGKRPSPAVPFAWAEVPLDIPFDRFDRASQRQAERRAGRLLVEALLADEWHEVG